MDDILGQSTWFLFPAKALYSTLQFLFYLAFSSSDGQLTRPLGTENAGFPGSSLALELLCLVDYIYAQLNQLFRNENTLLIVFLVFAIFFATFFAFFTVARIYRRRSIREQPSSAQSCSLSRSHSSNMTPRCDQTATNKDVPTQDVPQIDLASFYCLGAVRSCHADKSHSPPSETENNNDEKLHSLPNNKSTEHPTDKISSQHGGRTIGEEWVENGIEWKIDSNGELLRRDIVRRADSPSDSKRLARPEVYTEQWFTMKEYDEAVASRTLVTQETWVQRFLRAKMKQESSEVKWDLSSLEPIVCLDDRKRNDRFGLDAKFFDRLIYLFEAPVPTLAEQERHAEEQEILDKIASQQAEITHSLSPSVSSAEANEPSHPPTFFQLPAAVQAILQSTTSSESAPSNALPSIVVTSEEGETLNPTTLSNLSGTSISSEFNVQAAAPELDTRSLFSLNPLVRAPTTTGGIPIFGSSSTSATAFLAVPSSKPRRRTKVSSKRSLANRENRLSSYLSTRQGPDRTGSASVSSNTLDISPAPTSLPDDASGSGASTSTSPFTAVPDPLAIDQELPSTSSDATNEFAPSDSVPKRAKRSRAFMSDTEIDTAVLSQVSSEMEGSTSATAVDDTLATEVPAPVSLPASSDAVGPSQSVFDMSAIATAIESAGGGDDQPLEATQRVARSTRRTKQRKLAKRSRAQALKNAVNVTSTPTNTSAADEALVAELEALISLSDDEVSGAASPSQPTLDLSASTPAIEATPANNSSVAELDTLLSSSTPSDVADQFTPSDSKRSLTSMSDTTTVTATLSQVSSAMEGSTSVTAVDNTLATELLAPISLPALSGAADPSQSMFDLSALATAIDSAGGAAQPSDATPQVTWSKKRSKQRRRAKRALALTSDTATAAATSSQEVFALDGSTSATAMDDVMVTEPEVPASLSAPSDATGPSQPTSNMGADASAADFTMMDTTMVAGHEGMQFESTSSGPSQPTFDSGNGTFAVESAGVDNTWVAGYDPSQFPGYSQPTSDLGAGASSTDFDMIDTTMVTGYEAPQYVSTFDLRDGTSAVESAGVEWVAGYEQSQVLSALSAYSQPPSDYAGASAADFTSIDNTMVAGHEALQYASTWSEYSQPIFDLGDGTSVVESTTVNETLAAGYEALRFLSSLSDPSQPISDMGVDTSAAGPTTADDTWAAGYEPSESLSNTPGPSQSTFDMDAGTSTDDPATIYNSWVAGYQASQWRSLNSQHAIDDDDSIAPTIADSSWVEGFEAFVSTLSNLSQPTGDGTSGVDPVDPTPTDTSWVAGYEAFISTLSGSSEPTFDTGYDPSQFLNLSGSSQPAFDTGDDASAGDQTIADNSRVAGYEPPQHLSNLAGPSSSTFDLGDGTPATNVDNSWVAGYEASQFFNMLGLSQPTFDMGDGTSALDPGTNDHSWAAGYQASQSMLGSEPTFDTDAGTSADGLTDVDSTWVAGSEPSQYPSTSSGPSQPTFDMGDGTTAVDDTQVAGYDPSQFSSTLSGALTAESTIVDTTLVAGHESHPLPTTSSSAAGPSPIFDLNAATAEAEAKAADDALTAELTALLFPSSPPTGAKQLPKRQRKRAKASLRPMPTNEPSSSSSLYPSTQREPDLTGFGSVPFTDPTSASFPQHPSGSDSTDASGAPSQNVGSQFTFKFFADQGSANQ